MFRLSAGQRKNKTGRQTMKASRIWEFTTRVCALVVLSVGVLPVWADMSFTPRVTYYFDNITQRQSATNFNTPAIQQTVDRIGALAQRLGATFSSSPVDNARNSTQLAFPQFGGTLTYGWGGNDATQVALTGLYGRTTERDTLIAQEFLNFGFAGVNVQDTVTSTRHAKGDFTRLDLEATIQHRLNETFSFIGGVRAERTYAHFSGVTESTLSSNFTNLVASRSGGAPYYIPAQPPTQVDYSQTSWIYSARVGAAAYAPVGDKHLFYVNGLLQVSYSPSANLQNGFLGRTSTQTSLGPDFSVGYMYRISDRFGVDLRYRATVYFPISGSSDFKDSRVNHGVSLGFTTWFR
jgi:long-subunit fatty acid transport protein